MVIYIVNINYSKFEFMNGDTAIKFAELAMASAVDDVNIEINLKPVPKPEKGEDDDF